MENVEATSVDPAVKPSEGASGWMESAVITVSQTSVGQALLKLVDRFLWVVEKSAQWSLPCPDTAIEENGKSFGKMELVRPLPWILFLPGLVILRAMRAGLNVGAFVFGYPQIQPSGMVKYVQKSRRRLRALNLKAVKNSRRSTQDKRLSVIEAKKALIRSIRLTLSTLSCLDTSQASPSPPPTKIHISGDDFDMLVSPDEKSTTESAASPMHVEPKRKFSEVSSDDQSTDESDNETLQEKLERDAMSETSTEDPDFNPADCSTESSTASSENDVDFNVTLDELEDLKKEALRNVDRDGQSMGPILDAQNKQVPLELQKASAEESSSRAERVAQIAEEVAYHSPHKFGADGDTAFYSPISSKSGSPERSISPAEKDPQPYSNSHKENDFTNGEVNFNSGSMVSGAPKEEVINGVGTERRQANPGKHHHKGKRGGHGNRKKK